MVLPRFSFGFSIGILLAIGIALTLFLTQSGVSADNPHGDPGGAVDVDGFARKGATIEPGYLGSGAGIDYIQDTGSDQFVGVLFSAEDANFYYFAFEEDVNNNDNSYGDGSAPMWGNRGHRLKDLVNSEHAQIQLLGVPANPTTLDLQNPTVIGEFSLDYAYDDNTYDKVKGKDVALPGWSADLIDTHCQTAVDGAVISGIQPASCSTSLVYNIHTLEDGVDPLSSPTPYPDLANWVYELVYEFKVSKAAVANTGLVIHPFTPISIVEVHNSPFRIGNLPGTISGTLDKTSDPSSGSQVARPDDITYTVSFTNPNPTAITNVVITDPIDDNLEVTNAGGGTVISPYTGNCDNTGLTASCGTALEWTFASVPGFSTVSVTYTAKLASGTPLGPQGLVVYDQAIVDWDGAPTNLPGDGNAWTPQVNHTIIGVPAIAIDKNVSTSIGGPFTDSATLTPDNDGATDETVYWEVTYTNTGDVALDSIVLTESLGGLIPNGAEIPGDGQLDPSGVGPGESHTVVYTQTLTQAEIEGAGGSLTNTATVSAYDVANPTGTFPADCNTFVAAGNGLVCASDPATINFSLNPSLSTAKSLNAFGTGVDDSTDTDGSGDVSEGDVLRYTVTVSNTGNQTLTNVTVDDDKTGTVDASCAASLPVTNPDSSCSVVVSSYTVTAADVLAGSVTNIATGDSDESDPADGQLTVPVLEAVLALSKGATVTETTITLINNVQANSTSADSVNDSVTSLDVVIGSVIVYQMTVTNGGTGNAAAVSIIDTLPAGVTVSANPDGGIVLGNTVTWNLGPIAAGAFATVSLTVTTD